MKLFIDIHYKDNVATIYSEKFCTTVKFDTIEEFASDLKCRTVVRSYDDEFGEFTPIQVHELYIDISHAGYYLCHCLDREGVKYHQIVGKRYKNVLPVIL